ncbi:MAG: Gfo/Idh/MocA family oxidoreductase [Cyclobacteriaceae bacterium]|nr:Gfo/Idh/MocA family oxidoreductase [Cyclobacteriaceae bacterium]
MNKNAESRREFIRKTAIGSAGVAVGGILPHFSAKGYGRIMGANERINASIMGVNSRGLALANTFAYQPNCDLIHVCDVDSRVLANCLTGLKERQAIEAKGFGDFRRSLESRDVDVMVIATPDHWHAPAALLSMQAGKHVYVEKPCSHNPREGELLVEAATRYTKSVQMGNQLRSWPNVQAGINELKNGIIGRVYFGKAWYTNNRPSIGIGQKAPVPDWLDWQLWQGPAPRRDYKDNLVHYNWHWHWHWGTGEALNNGTHTMDILRWGLEVDFPMRVNSNGGRYRYQDDWETPDTQVITLDFEGGKTLTWEGRSCNGKDVEGSTGGVMFYGENGSMHIPVGNSYTVYDLKSQVVKEVKDSRVVDSRNATSPAEHLDALHVQNLFDAIRSGGKLNSHIREGHKSTLLAHLGNIAQRVGRTLYTDPSNGRILRDEEAMKLWGRSYEKGWELNL